jgi:hypothetical protein
MEYTKSHHNGIWHINYDTYNMQCGEVISGSPYVSQIEPKTGKICINCKLVHARNNKQITGIINPSMKCRIYHIPTNKYVTTEQYISSGVWTSSTNDLTVDPNGSLVTIGYSDSYPTIDPNNYIIEYCSGVKDSNGTDIYVGDIMKHKVMGEQAVVFSCGKFQLKNGTYFVKQQADWPIIGNIHELNI